MVVVAVAVLVPIAIDAAIVTNTIRLGPSSYDLPPNAMSVTLFVRLLGESANSTQYDYYSLLINITNNVTDSSIRPYGIDVRVPLPGAGFWGWWPENPYFASQQHQVTADDGETLLLSAGQFLTYANPLNVGAGTSVMHWVVEGVSSAGNVAVMDYRAQFYVSHVMVAKGSLTPMNANVTLTWDYRSSLQTYAVASRTVTLDFLIGSARAST